MTRPKIGVGVLIFKDMKILLGKRKGSHGENTWAPPGGHLEMYETPEECAHREVLEETGLKITDLRRGPYTNDFFLEEKKHYITLYMISNHLEGEPALLEPDKCIAWNWFHWNELPSNLFLSLINLRKTPSFSPWPQNSSLL